MNGMTIFQVNVSNWLVQHIKQSATIEGREIDALNFKTPLYMPQEEYDSGVAGGYVVDHIPTEKFKEEFSYHVTMIGIIK